MDILYMDFHRAFDTILHNILLSKLERYVFDVNCLANEELVGQSHPDGSGQGLNVQMELNDEWCSMWFSVGTGSV